MQLHVPDPAFTGSQQARIGFRRAVVASVSFVALLWLIELANGSLGLGLSRFGVHPREWAGLVGLLFAPLLHGGVDHLMANSLPLLILGTTMLHLYPRSSRLVLPLVWIGPGLLVWMFARGGVHIGASGLVYGLVSYIFLAGVLRRDKRAIAASMLVAFMYGYLAWGVLPTRAAISWEGHLAAAVIGLVMALLLRKLDVPPRRRYSWEDEPEERAVEADPELESVPPMSERAFVYDEPPPGARTLH